MAPSQNSDNRLLESRIVHIRTISLETRDFSAVRGLVHGSRIHNVNLICRRRDHRRIAHRHDSVWCRRKRGCTNRSVRHCPARNSPSPRQITRTCNRNMIRLFFQKKRNHRIYEARTNLSISCAVKVFEHID